MAQMQRDKMLGRLRTFGAWADVQPRHALVKDAATQIETDGQKIEALEADNARLREALEQFLSLIEYQYCGSREAMNALQEADNSARAALEPMSKENAETFARSGNV